MSAKGSQEASEHLLYEVEALEDLVHVIEAAKAGTALNAYIESFLVHARLIAHFLNWHRNSTKPDDMLAEDFVRTWTPGSTPPALTVDTMKRMNKRIMHLSYERKHASVAADDWDFSGIAISILEKVGAFVHDAMHSTPCPLAPKWTAWGAVHDVYPPSPSALGVVGVRHPFKHSIRTGITGATGMKSG